MEHAAATITVLFEAPFWIGLYQRESEEEGYTVSKIIFGPEPKDCEVYELLLHHWSRLKFSPPIEGGTLTQKTVSPKRRQREIRKQVSRPEIGTKAQQALQKQREAAKQVRQTTARQRREESAERRYQLRQEKRKEKHRGH